MHDAVLTATEPQVDCAGEPRRLRVGVLISGSGTNLQALIDRSAAGTLDAEVVVVISNKEAAYGLERARRAQIPAVWIDPATCASPAPSPRRSSPSADASCSRAAPGSGPR